MNHYFYKVRIFDTAVDADMEFFPRVESFSAFAKNEEEAQREIVDQIFDPESGVCGTRQREDDAVDRFRIVFDDEPEMVRPVEWDSELNTWMYADEEYPPEERERQKKWVEKNS